MNDASTRVIIADDHLVFRQGLRNILTNIIPAATVQEVGTYDSLIEIAGNAPVPDH